MRDWYEPEPEALTAQADGRRAILWGDILGHWRLLALDLHDRHIDVESGVLHERSWAWLTVHVTDIADTAGTRLNHALTTEGAP